jgi:TetR/AcrR family transcriptional regulator
MSERPAEPAPAGRRRIGRPRHDPRPVVGDPTDEILGTAARLFGEFGVTGTTMSRIASEVGLKQSSLYYHFHSRDEVVAALMARANVVPLELVDRVSATDDPVPVQLYRFVKGDVEALCSLPFDINEVHRIAARDVERFADYWSDRRRLERKLAGLVRRGTEDGALRAVSPRLTALTIMANDEGVQNWFRLGTTSTPAQIARHLAELTVAGLLPVGRSLEEIAEAAARAERAAQRR